MLLLFCKMNFPRGGQTTTCLFPLSLPSEALEPSKIGSPSYSPGIRIGLSDSCCCPLHWSPVHSSYRIWCSCHAWSGVLDLPHLSLSADPNQSSLIPIPGTEVGYTWVHFIFSCFFSGRSTLFSISPNIHWNKHCRALCILTCTRTKCWQL